MSYFDPDLVPAHCVACGGWDQSAGGSGHKLGCPKGAHRTRILAPPSPYWIMIGRWSTLTTSDSWAVRSVIERIKSESGAEIVHYIAKGEGIGIIVTDLDKEPGTWFANYTWYKIVKLDKSEATKERLMEEIKSS